MAKAIMVQGTASNAGKSLLSAALCRIFWQDGRRTAPFKAQNMALNSFITAAGGEIGRAQAMQAEAAGIPPEVRMNPILLKPSSEVGSQLIVNGTARGHFTAQEYYSFKKALIPTVRQAYESLAAENDVIVIEGAGSPAEINLKQDDFVNMGMAEIADAPVLLVGDIDRGGVFAALYGTVLLLEEAERARVRALIINKFRGDPAILQPGLAQLEALTKKPVAGVVPWTPLDLDEEDSLSDKLRQGGEQAPLCVAVVRLPRLSNFTDLAALGHVSGVGVRYAARPRELENADLIILPGTKSTLADLKWLRESGMEAAVLKRHAAGTPVFGICGGYQMLGNTVSDPAEAEGGGELRGLGLLPVDTVFRPEKTTVQVSGAFQTVAGVFSPLSGVAVRGYEIHMGETTRQKGARPLVTLRRGETEIADGCQAENAYGTYLHGVFDGEGVALRLAEALAAKRGLTLAAAPVSEAQYKQIQYDKLADTVRASLDMALIYRVLEGNV